MLKKISRHPAVQTLLARSMAAYLSFVWRTSKWHIEGRDLVENSLLKGIPVIIVFWHSRMCMAPFAWVKGHPFSMLISEHSDGRLISKIVSYFGIDTVYGSSSKGGRSALSLLLKHLEKGESVGITPDGPRGPREVAKPGVFTLAMLSQRPVLCLSFALSRCRFLSSWDRFCFPLPFSTGALVYTKPKIEKACKGQREIFLGSLEEALKEAEHKAMAWVTAL